MSTGSLFSNNKNRKIVFIFFCVCLVGCGSHNMESLESIHATEPVTISTQMIEINNQQSTPPLTMETIQYPQDFIQPFISATTTATLDFSLTSAITSTISDTPMPINTPTVFPTSIPGVIQHCLKISDVIRLSDIGLQGTIALMGIYPQSIPDSYLLDLSSGETKALPTQAMSYMVNGAVSPDRNWFAYEGAGEDLTSGRQLVIVDSQGVVQKTINLSNIKTPASYMVLTEWLENNHLVFTWGEERDTAPIYASTIFVNPFTEESTEYQSNYPNLYYLYPNYLYIWSNYGPTLSVYNTSVDRVLFLSFDGVVLWNLTTQQQIRIFEDIPEYNLTNPVWSPDGERFIMDQNTASGRNLFLVTKNGVTQQITFFNGRNGFGTNMGDFTDYAWSPDGKSIAFWLMTGIGERAGEAIYDLAILDLISGEIHNYCIDKFIWRNIEPVWSPDGKWLVVPVPNGFSPGSDSLQRAKTILIDINRNQAYSIAEEVVPLGWMVND